MGIQDRYEAVFGFNSKQWWVYDSDNDRYIDPPKDVLDSLPYWKEDPDAAKKAFQMIINELPNWLNDEDYQYDAEEMDI